MRQIKFFECIWLDLKEKNYQFDWKFKKKKLYTYFAFLADFLQIISKTSELMQRRDTFIASINPIMKRLIEKLMLLKTIDGLHLKSFYQSCTLINDSAWFVNYFIRTKWYSIQKQYSNWWSFRTSKLNQGTFYRWCHCTVEQLLSY